MVEDRGEIKTLLDGWAVEEKLLYKVNVVGLVGFVVVLRRVNLKKTEAGYVASNLEGYIVFQEAHVDYIQLDDNRKGSSIFLNLKGAQA